MEERYQVGADLADEVVWITCPCGIGDEDDRHLTMRIDAYGHGESASCPGCGQRYRSASEIQFFVIAEYGKKITDEVWIRAY